MKLGGAKQAGALCVYAVCFTCAFACAMDIQSTAVPPKSLLHEY
jgi:hypothetical protein